MLTIWKVALEPIYNQMQEISIRAPGILCRFRNQRNVPTVWFIVETESPVMLQTFILMETGKDLNQACFTEQERSIMGSDKDPTQHGFYTSFVGTAVFDDGDYVLHLFSRADLTRVITPPPADKMN